MQKQMDKLQKFNEDILKKKILAASKELNITTSIDDLTKDELVNFCFKLELEVKELKDKQKLEKERIAEEQRMEEEKEKEERRLEKEEREKLLNSLSIVDYHLTDRLKYKFFNLVVPDDEGYSSPPFFDNIKDQFKDEFFSKGYKLYKAVYPIDDEIQDKPEYMQKNLNTTLVSMVEESEYKKLLFVCFRLLKSNNKCSYVSYWISNININLSELSFFDQFIFTKHNNIDDFMKGSCNEEIIEEKYAR